MLGSQNSFIIFIQPDIDVLVINERTCNKIDPVWFEPWNYFKKPPRDLTRLIKYRNENIRLSNLFGVLRAKRWTQNLKSQLFQDIALVWMRIKICTTFALTRKTIFTMIYCQQDSRSQTIALIEIKSRSSICIFQIFISRSAVIQKIRYIIHRLSDH